MYRSNTKPIRANIATLKVHLGRFLKRVRKGQEVIVVDRQTPVAKLVPLILEEDLCVQKATRSWRDVENELRKNDLIHKPHRLSKTSLYYLQIEREKE